MRYNKNIFSNDINDQKKKNEFQKLFLFLKTRNTRAPNS